MDRKGFDVVDEIVVQDMIGSPRGISDGRKWLFDHQFVERFMTEGGHSVSYLAGFERWFSVFGGEVQFRVDVKCNPYDGTFASRLEMNKFQGRAVDAVRWTNGLSHKFLNIWGNYDGDRSHVSSSAEESVKSALLVAKNIADDMYDLYKKKYLKELES